MCVIIWYKIYCYLYGCDGGFRHNNFYEILKGNVNKTKNQKLTEITCLSLLTQNFIDPHQG